MFGGGGAGGTTTVNTFAHLVGDDSATGDGAGFVTFDNGGANNRNARLLNTATEYAATITSGSAVLDNVRLTAQSYSFETETREINTYVGGTAQFKLSPGPAYAGKWYIILQGFSGFHPGFDMNGGTVHVPLNPDAWTFVALDLNPLWPGFFSQLDANGEATATFDSFGDQPKAFSLAIDFVFMVLQNPGSTPIFASNPIYVLFTAP